MSPAPAKPGFTLYWRSYCHLCEDMLAALQALRRSHSFELEILDIDEDPALQQRYDEWVPVLVRDGEEVCHYHFDRDRVLAALDDRASTD